MVLCVEGTYLDLVCLSVARYEDDRHLNDIGSSKHLARQRLLSGDEFIVLGVGLLSRLLYLPYEVDKALSNIEDKVTMADCRTKDAVSIRQQRLAIQEDDVGEMAYH